MRSLKGGKTDKTDKKWNTGGQADRQRKQGRAVNGGMETHQDRKWKEKKTQKTQKHTQEKKLHMNTGNDKHKFVYYDITDFGSSIHPFIYNTTYKKKLVLLILVHTLYYNSAIF